MSASRIAEAEESTAESVIEHYFNLEEIAGQVKPLTFEVGSPARIPQRAGAGLMVYSLAKQ